MSDSDSAPGRPAIPSWQQSETESEAAPTPSSTSSSTSEVDAPTADAPADTPVDAPAEETPVASQDEHSVEVARRFLENDDVRHASHDSKVAFLKSKGIDEADIETLLGQQDSSTTSETDAGASTSNSQSSFVPAPTETLSPT
ncbi:hypothetical protein FZEAL_10335, partial [Fusarium zealandicum]